MAWSEKTTQVTFSSGNNTATLLAGGSVESDALQLTLGAVARDIRVLVEPGATAPTSGVIEVHWCGIGDINADAADDKDTQGTRVGKVDPVSSTDEAKPLGLITVNRNGTLRFDSSADQDVTISAVIVETIWS